MVVNGWIPCDSGHVLQHPTRGATRVECLREHDHVGPHYSRVDYGEIARVDVSWPNTHEQQLDLTTLIVVLLFIPALIFALTGDTTATIIGGAISFVTALFVFGVAASLKGSEK